MALREHHAHLGASVLLVFPARAVHPYHRAGDSIRPPHEQHATVSMPSLRSFRGLTRVRMPSSNRQVIAPSAIRDGQATAMVNTPRASTGLKPRLARSRLKLIRGCCRVTHAARRRPDNPSDHTLRDGARRGSAA